MKPSRSTKATSAIECIIKPEIAIKIANQWCETYFNKRTYVKAGRLSIFVMKLDGFHRFQGGIY
jgi:hypothetical protein